jgi:hypothetical protein
VPTLWERPPSCDATDCCTPQALEMPDSLTEGDKLGKAVRVVLGFQRCHCGRGQAHWSLSARWLDYWMLDITSCMPQRGGSSNTIDRHVAALHCTDCAEPRALAPPSRGTAAVQRCSVLSVM